MPIYTQLYGYTGVSCKLTKPETYTIDYKKEHKTKINLMKFIFFILFINISINLFAQDDKHSINDLLGKEVPCFKGLLISGDSISSSELVGKVTLIQFLYLGCMPCMHEVPFYNDLYKELEHTKFDLIAICPETFNTIKTFNDNDSTSPANGLHKFYNLKSIDYKIIAECNEMSYPFGRPQCSTISEKFYIRGYPYSVLVDKFGIIRRIYGGFTLDYNEGKKKMGELKADIENLIK